MRADEIRFLFDYSYAATARILDAAGRLDNDQFVGPSPVRGCAGLRDLLVHLLDRERAWREGLSSRGAYASPPLDPATFPDVAELAQAWHTEEGAMRSWLAGLDDADMNLPAAGRPLWQCLLHIVNHATQHRSEAAMLLTHWWHSPGELDLIYFRDDWGASPDVRLGPPPEQ